MYRFRFLIHVCLLPEPIVSLRFRLASMPSELLPMYSLVHHHSVFRDRLVPLELYFLRLSQPLPSVLLWSGPAIFDTFHHLNLDLSSANLAGIRMVSCTQGGMNSVLVVIPECVSYHYLSLLVVPEILTP